MSLKLKMFAVYDSAVKAFDRPFVMRTEGEALRGWDDICNDEGNAICRHPEHFTLFELGEYDTQNGTFQNHETPISRGLATQFKKVSNVSQLKG